jgi:hypothetical protein
MNDWAERDNLLDLASFHMYHGQRVNPTTVQVDVAFFTDKGPDLANEIGRIPLKHYPMHSPDGFEWGYGGSGPADLALAILLDYFHEDPTPAQLRARPLLGWALHQEFKKDFVSGWRESFWAVHVDSIRMWLTQPHPKAILEAARKDQQNWDRALEEAETEPLETLTAAEQIIRKLEEGQS